MLFPARLLLGEKVRRMRTKFVRNSCPEREGESERECWCPREIPVPCEFSLPRTVTTIRTEIRNRFRPRSGFLSFQDAFQAGAAAQ